MNYEFYSTLPPYLIRCSGSEGRSGRIVSSKKDAIARPSFKLGSFLSHLPSSLPRVYPPTQYPLDYREGEEALESILEVNKSAVVTAFFDNRPPLKKHLSLGRFEEVNHY